MDQGFAGESENPPGKDFYPFSNRSSFELGFRLADPTKLNESVKTCSFR